MSLAPVVQKVDSTIQWIVQLVLLILNHWIVIYPVASTIQLLNNWGLMNKVMAFTYLRLYGLYKIDDLSTAGVI